MKYVNIVMPIVYIIFGILMVWKQSELFTLPDNVAVILGIILIGYGFFRSYRTYQQYFQK